MHIVRQGAFTPRNVQIAEACATTIFALKLSIDNAADKLKPGMLAAEAFQE